MAKLTFEEFLQEVEGRLFDYLPEGYADEYDIYIFDNYCINLEFKYLSLRKKEGIQQTVRGANLTSIYEDLYPKQDIDSILQIIARNLSMPISKEEFSSLRGFLNQSQSKEDILSCVIPCLINKDYNKEFLKSLPHREFLDLALIYKCSPDKESRECFSITNQFMKTLDLTEQELFEAAICNVHDSLLIYDVCDLITEPEEEDKEFFDHLKETPEQQKLLLASNDSCLYGASAMLFKDFLSQIATRLKTSFYILPSSVHELLFLSTDNEPSVEHLSSLVFSVNRTSLINTENLM